MNEETTIPEDGELTAELRADAFAAGLVKVTETPTEPVTVMAQITQDQWLQAQAGLSRLDRLDEIEANTKRGLDTAFGKVGALTQALEKLKTATGAVDDADFSELAQEFPELVPLMVAGINAASKKGGQSFDMTAVEAMAEARAEAKVSEVRDAMDLQIATLRLEQRHHDWQEVVGEQGFQALVASKSADVQARLTGRDHKFIASFITDYKASKANLVDPATRRDRMSAAITPRGNGNADPQSGSSRRDHFLSGLKKGP